MIYIFKKLSKFFNLKLVIVLICFAFILSIISVLGNKKLTQPSIIIEQRQSPVFLSLQSPADNQIIKGKNLVVKGKTLPKSTVVIFTENNVNSVESDANGNFKESIELSSGLNKLTVSAFAQNGEEKKVTLDIVYDSDNVKGDKDKKDEEHGKSDEAPGQEKKQEEASSQSQPQQSQPQQEQSKSQQQPAQENKPEQQASSGQSTQAQQAEQKATVGSVERVTSNSIVVEEKNPKKTVETKVDKDTLIRNQENKVLELRKIKPKDEAAIITDDKSSGKNITAPGNEGTPDKAVRIYVNQASASAQPSQSKRHAIQGVISNIVGNEVTLMHLQQANRSFSFLVNNQTVVKTKHVKDATIKYLKVGQIIAAVGDLTDQNMLLASWIHVIKDVDSLEPTILPSISLAPISVTPTSVTLPSENPISTIITTPALISSTVPTITPEVTLIPTPTPVPCSLISAYWNTSSNLVSDGTSVGLKVSATGDCDGKQVTFEIYENDSLAEGGIDDQVNTQSGSITFSDSLGEVEGEWTTVWENDCLGFCNPPEYYFKASLVDDNTIQSGSPLLMVEPLNSSQLTPKPSPTPTLEVASVDLIAKYIGVGQTGINQYLSFTAQYYSPNTIPLSSMTNYNQGLLARHTYWYDDQVIYDFNLVIQAKTDWMFNFPFDTTIKPILITAGTHKIKACIDTSDVILESDNVNNCKEVSFEALSVALPPPSPCYTTLDEACAAINCPLDAQHFCSNRTVPNRPGCVEATGCTTIPTNSIVSTSTLSPALTPSPAPVPCSLTSASWNAPSNPVTEGTGVKLKVMATGDCSSQQVIFKVRENDSLLEGGFDDLANIQPSPVVFSLNAQSVEGIWVAEWQNDCAGFCNPPEYFFDATLTNGNTIRGTDPLLSVTSVASKPSPTPTLEVASVDLIAKYIGVGQTGINQYLSFTAQYYSPNTIPLSSMTNYNQGLLARHTYWYDDQVIYDFNLVIQAKTDWMFNFPFDTTIKPILITAGTHKIKACIDTSDVILESDNVNNCKEVSFEALSVALPPPSPCYTTLDEACAAINCPLDAQHFCSNRTVPNRPGCVEATGCTTLP